MEYTLITGAASGLGKEFAKLYAKNKENLILADVNVNGLEICKKEINKDFQDVNVEIKAIDVSDMDSIKLLITQLENQKIFVSRLLNCAGFGDREDFLKMDIDKQIKMTEVNCNALLLLCHEFGKKMCEAHKGHIINVSSIAGFIPGPYMCTYHATKGYVLLLSESIAYEFNKFGVKVLTLCPGPFKSDFVKKAHNDYTFKKIKPLDAATVAKKAYKASRRGKKILITGFKNKLTIFVTRLFPRSLVTKVSAKNMKADA